ncbi:MAG TPA: glucosamine-6-phosphate deaminase [Candidatus Limivicinus faecipullorum]|nr:glucosamine-6-phosphate deaminase [Candidatus Limivicinus faecipullorum]
MKTLIKELPEMEKICAEKVRQLLKEKPGSVLALTAGRTTEGLYALLGDMCRRGELSFREAKIFAVTEYVGGEEADSCRSILKRQLIDHTDLPEGNFFVPREQEPEKYDGLIEAAGGIDLCILGIGINGHIGYNEPATAFDSLTHIQKLTDATHRQYSGGERHLTEYALTMGIKTIVSSREIFLLASGPEKADAVFKMIYGRTDSYIPAAFLQIPLEVTVCADPAAAAKL